ncbi:MAG: hypothetical protein ABFS34_10850 [Gemmatimonadota bacterium]
MTATTSALGFCAPRGAALLLLVTALASCGDRARPTGLPTEPGAVDLSVQLLAPEQGQARMAGTSVAVTVRANEPNARLIGVGFEARLNSFAQDLIDSAQVSFPGVSDTIFVFDYPIPPDFTNNVQINFFGVAFGQNGARAVSIPRSAIIIN